MKKVVKHGIRDYIFKDYTIPRLIYQTMLGTNKKTTEHCVVNNRMTFVEYGVLIVDNVLKEIDDYIFQCYIEGYSGAVIEFNYPIARSSIKFLADYYTEAGFEADVKEYNPVKFKLLINWAW